MVSLEEVPQWLPLNGMFDLHQIHQTWYKIISR
jgi:hypothetical protein